MTEHEFPASAATRPSVAKAVALSHDPAAGEGVPRIVAKGMGAVAEKILDIAFAHDVKVRQDADLVEVLVALELDTLIPVETYAAVAEILAYVYKANAAARRQFMEGVSHE